MREGGEEHEYVDRSPTPTRSHKRVHASDDGDDEIDEKPQKRTKTHTKAGPKPKTRETSTGTSTGVEKKRGAWSKEEILMLWEALDLVPDKINWEAIAPQVPGRDKIACRDKWKKTMLPKIIDLLNGLGN